MNKIQESKIEIYTLQRCPYCKKAKAFLKSKGLDYQEYNIDDKGIKLEMENRTGGAKTVPQIFIDDYSIGGFDDLMEMKRSGKLELILDMELDKNFQKKWDLLIIGAGPAGFNAALYSARKGLDVLMVSSDIGGQMADTGEVGNYLGMLDVTGSELIDDFYQHVMDYNVSMEIGETVKNIRKEDDKFFLETESEKELEAKAIIIATGASNRQLGVEGEKEFRGKGVHYCATCDGFLYAGKRVAVVGGGNSGLEASLDLANLSCNVVLVEFQDKLTGDRVLVDKVLNNDNIQVYTAYGVEEIKGDKKLDSIIIKNVNTEEKEKVDVEAVFVEIGLIPNNDFARDILKVNKVNEIVINENNETSIKGIWAAGDVTNIKDKQIIISAGEGAKAALRVSEYLTQH
ncbi:glutaredoxin 3 [Natronospora cellulosivora (SeqCode)]